MTDKLTIALAQLNPVVGKIDFNLNKLREVRARAAKVGADLVATSELYSCGYPPEDLVLKTAFQDKFMQALKEINLSLENKNCTVILGMPRINYSYFGNAWYQL